MNWPLNLAIGFLCGIVSLHTGSEMGWFFSGSNIALGIVGFFDRNSSAASQAPRLQADEKAVPPFNKRGTAPSHGQD